MLWSEQEPDVLQSVFVAFSHLHEPKAIPLATKYASHRSPDVRHAVVLALSGQDHPLAVDLLVQLTSDSDSDVRDWATFALGTQTELDTPQIREALAARLNDSDLDTRCEAMIGLAHRHDQRTIPAIGRELEKEEIGHLAIEAAAISASPALLPPLRVLREVWQCDTPSILHEAIAACQKARA
jgi:HEAT repeat protein